MLQRIKSKKGFTLAELLIVVAIIAVLTAIAVPLFVNALGDAKTNAKNANITAVKEAAIVYVLTHTTDTELYDTATGKLKSTDIYASAKVSKTGDVTDLQVSTNKDKVSYGTADNYDESTGLVTVKISELVGKTVAATGE